MEKFKNFLISFGLIFLYIVLSVFVHSIIKIVGGDVNTQSIFLIIGDILITLLFMFIFREKISLKWDEFRRNRKNYIRDVMKYWIIGFIIMIVSNIIVVNYFLDGISPNELANRELIKTMPIYMGLSCSIFGPICEELLFRESFSKVFNRKYSFIVFTGLLFAGMHVVGVTSLKEMLYLIPYSALGITFSLIYYDTDNICSSILAHMIHNTLSFVLIVCFM